MKWSNQGHRAAPGAQPEGTSSSGVPGPAAALAEDTSNPQASTGNRPHGTALRLAKAVGVLAIMASAVSQEYGSGINYVLVNSVGPYPEIRTLVPIAMFAAGLLMLPNVVMFTRFGRVMPRAGSTYVWLTRSVNMPIGFLVAFLWFVGVVAAIGFLAFSFPVFIQGILTQLGVSSTWPVSTTGHLVLGLVLIWLMALLHYSGVRNYGAFVILIFAIVLFAAVSTIYFGFTTSQHTFLTDASQQIGQALRPDTVGPASAGVFFSVVTLFMFSYGGLAAATSLGGEARDAKRSIPRGIWYAWGTAIVLYTAVAFALYHAVPWWSVHPLVESGHSALATTPGLIGLIAPKVIGLVINIAVVLIVGKTVAPELLDCSRYLFAWAQDGLLPKAFLHTNRRRAPDIALLVSAILGSGFLVEATFFGFQIGVVLRSMSLVLVFGVLGIGVLNLRFNPRFKNVPWAREIVRHPTVLIAAVLGIVIAVVLERSVLIVPDEPVILQPSVQALIALVLGLGLYIARRVRGVRDGNGLAAGPLEAPPE
ncbi:MAG: APC family permease [Sciscionella sp.]